MAVQKHFALVDCNNFYVSCERLFRPDLRWQPVAVLSNNDGCIVSRSQEVKALGIKMAVPVYQIDKLVKQHRVHLFSSNYTLYADISSRVMSLLAEFSPHIEVYSIDEAFLELTGFTQDDPMVYGQLIRETVERATGIPVCVGMGPTKTLAKLANFAAKKWQKSGGVVNLDNAESRAKLMRRVPVDEVWGIGSRLAKKLNQLGVRTVWDLSRQMPDRMQSLFSVVAARTVMELNGISCLALQEIVPAKQQIVCSRSFKRRLTVLTDLSEALSGFCCRAAEKLREQQSVTGCISVFIRTNPFNSAEPQYQQSACRVLPYATQDNRYIISYAKQLLKQIFKSGYGYQKCGVCLSYIQPEAIPEQLDLFNFPRDKQRSREQRLIRTFDAINQRFPQGISIAAVGLEKSWQYQPAHLSGRFTTHWNELARVKCG
jgi:DNA polymerase V